VSREIDTTPTSRRPPLGFIEVAKREIPGIMASIGSGLGEEIGVVFADGTYVMVAGVLALQITKFGHSVPAAQWAIYRLVEDGLLLARLRWTESELRDMPEESRRLFTVDPTKPVPYPSLIVGSTQKLWDWWDELGDDKSGKTQIKWPDNAIVRNLCKVLAERKSTDSQLGLARQITGEKPGKDKKAKSILRQARRYRHLWETDT
jgi:hypothetical protein